MRVAVTGAGGFIGANLVRRLLAEGHEVCAILRPGGSRARLSELDLAVAEACICDREALSEVLLAHRPEIVYHLASSTWNRQTQKDEHERVIRGGTESLLAACERWRPRRLIAAGSAAEYGSGVGFDEDSLCRPDTALGAAKAAACQLATVRAPQLGIERVWLRLFTPYGPFEAASRLVPSAIRAALSRQTLLLQSPNDERDFLAISDVVEAMTRAALAPLPCPAILNVCSGEPTRVSNLTNLVFACAGVEPNWRAPTGTGESSNRETLSRSSGCNQRAREWLGWSPHVDLSAGIEQAIAWWKDPSS